MPELWVRQEYETDTSFYRFRHYYLSQQPPRSVDEAYRIWQQKERGKGANEVRKMRASGRWQEWAWPKGDDVKSWPERAKAYDDYRLAEELAELEARHMPEAEVIALISDIARGDLGEFADVQGLDSLKGHPYSYLVNNLVERVSHNDKTGATSRNFQIKLESKLDALEKLARHYGLYDDPGSSENRPLHINISSFDNAIKKAWGNDDTNNGD